MFEPNSLLEYWNPLVERCGLILQDDKVIEVPNTHSDPSDNFKIGRSYFIENPSCVATWHTHPKGSPNLSAKDYFIFLEYPEYFHYIIGNGIVWGFYVRENRVYLYEEANLSGVSERPIS